MRSEGLQASPEGEACSILLKLGGAHAPLRVTEKQWHRARAPGLCWKVGGRAPGTHRPRLGAGLVPARLSWVAPAAALRIEEVGLRRGLGARRMLGADQCLPSAFVHRAGDRAEKAANWLCSLRRQKSVLIWPNSDNEAARQHRLRTGFRMETQDWTA